MRYVIALLAMFPNLFIQEAQRQFSTVSQGYLLSNNSLPHITLAQFYLDDEDRLIDIWHEIRTNVINVHQPRFLGISLTRKAKILWGISLLATRESELVKKHTVYKRIK